MLEFIKVYSVVNQRRIGLYRCSCGNLMTARMSAVKYGTTKSCGCLKTIHIEKINKRRSNARCLPEREAMACT